MNEINKEINKKLEKLQKRGTILYGLIILIILFLIVSLIFEFSIIFMSFPLIILVTLILSPLIWDISKLNNDRDKYWALKEDAYTKGVLANLIDASPGIRDKMLIKFFDHHHDLGSAQLIANWNQPHTNVSNNVLLDKIMPFSKKTK